MFEWNLLNFIGITFGLIFIDLILFTIAENLLRK